MWQEYFHLGWALIYNCIYTCIILIMPCFLRRKVAKTAMGSIRQDRLNDAVKLQY